MFVLRNVSSPPLQVRTWKMHLYTIVQMVCVAALFGLKNSPAGMLYPVVIITLLPLKWVLGKYFYSHDEIEAVSAQKTCYMCDHFSVLTALQCVRS